MRRRRIRGVETLNNKLTVSIRKVYLPDGEMIVFITTYHMMDDLYVTKVVYSGDHQVIYTGFGYTAGILNIQPVGTTYRRTWCVCIKTTDPVLFYL